MTTQEIASPLPICHFTEAERDAYAWLYVQNTHHDVHCVDLPVGSLCHVCRQPICAHASSLTGSVSTMSDQSGTSWRWPRCWGN